MEALPDEAPEESLEPKNTDKPPMDSHRDGQQNQGKGKAEDQTNDRIPAQALQLFSESNTDGQADYKAFDDTLHGTADQVDFRAARNANVAHQRAPDGTDQEWSEQSHKKAFSQAGYVESEQKAAEQRDHIMTHHSEQRFSDQFDSRLSGLVHQKTSKRTDYRLPDQDDHTPSMEFQYKLYEQDEQLDEDQAVDEAHSSADYLTAEEIHGGDFKKHDYFMDKEENYMKEFLAGYTTHNYFDSRIATQFGDTEDVREVDSCTFEDSQMNRKTSNISVSSETDTQSTTDLKKLESLESRFTRGLQIKKQAFPQLFPSILTKFDRITNQEKTEATEIKSGDVSEHQGMSLHEYPQTSGKRFPPIVYEDPYQVSLRYMEKHNILQVFQKITENLVYEKPEDPLRFMLYQLHQTKRKADRY
ncbi:PREDICTED: uncharacterized protein C3orf30 homolog [Condylura cristata]|uniref:uncharacterized protein C3orf30 homolog n=1 Tax=Condylura cristata TaxID=143302 RepID=UPI00033475C7|nr:PREDICTED: uncharacterized protein C3orf30 homolog [Condylura cristata]